MFLLIRNSNLLNSNLLNYKIWGNNFQNAKEVFNDITELKQDIIEEILIYGNKNDDDSCCKMATCKYLNTNNDSLYVQFANVEKIERRSEVVRKKVYRYMLKSGRVKSGDNLPFVIIVNDYNNYMDIKEKNDEIKYESLLKQITEMKTKSKWLDIINLFKVENIEKTEFWENAKCLSELHYALSKIVTNTSKKAKDDVKKHTPYFLKVSERCLQLEPNNVSLVSVNAYYYYNLIKTQKMFDDNYEKTLEKYKWLIENSKHNYKEIYRYVRLKESYYDYKKFKSYEEVKNYPEEIIAGLKHLIKIYDDLDEEYKKRDKKEYEKSIYAYCRFIIEKKLNFWKQFCDERIFNIHANLNKESVELISEMDDLLKKLVDLCGFDTIRNIKGVDFNNKPSYIDVYYRMAQLEQAKGILGVIKGQGDFRNIFLKSNEYIDNIINLSDKQKRNGVRFLYPYYIYNEKAINLFFLQDKNECLKCFNMEKAYVLYNEAIIYSLYGDKDKALSILDRIPKTDLCYNKSQKLKEALNNNEL